VVESVDPGSHPGLALAFTSLVFPSFCCSLCHIGQQLGLSSSRTRQGSLPPLSVLLQALNNSPRAMHRHRSSLPVEPREVLSCTLYCASHCNGSGGRPPIRSQCVVGIPTQRRSTLFSSARSSSSPGSRYGPPGPGP
jgi:hypothetical protein